jgi:hypothetical protein
VSYFRPQKARKIGLRSIHSLLHSTQKVSQKGGRVTASCIQLRKCLKKGVGSSPETAPNLVCHFKGSLQPCARCGQIREAGKIKAVESSAIW